MMRNFRAGYNTVTIHIHLFNHVDAEIKYYPEGTARKKAKKKE